MSDHPYAILIAAVLLAFVFGLVVGEEVGRGSEREEQQAYDKAQSNREFVRKLCNSVWLEWKDPTQ